MKKLIDKKCNYRDLYHIKLIRKCSRNISYTVKHYYFLYSETYFLYRNITLYSGTSI